MPGPSALGILQARILEWVAMPSSRGSSDPGIKPVSHVSCIEVAGFFFFFLTSDATWEALISYNLSQNNLLFLLKFLLLIFF